MRPWLLLSIILLRPPFAGAQETRAAAIEAAQAEKAANLAPHQTSWAEQLLLTMRQSIILQPSGFYPYFDSVYSGGGFTLGAGHRRFWGDRTHTNIAGLYSGKGYKLIEAGVQSPGHRSGRLDLAGVIGWRDATQVAYHGLGIDSPADTDTAFRMQQTYARGEATGRPLPWLRVTAAASYEDYAIKDPTGDQTPVEAVYSPEQAPGVGVDPEYFHTMVSVSVDTRPATDYARRGAMYEVAHHYYADREQIYSFRRFDAEAVQHIPVLRENWVISLHGRLESTEGDDAQVPYFLLPSLGSGSTLRAYSSWRFRDRHAALVSGEFRWIANRLALDMALFVDSGVVAPRLDALSTRHMVGNYGVGVRFHGPARTPLRVELAHGREGMHLVFAASAAF